MSNRRNPLIIAHRGAALPVSHPENTVAAFRRARSVASDWVELDVRRTADAKTAIHHDPHLADGRLIASLERSSLPGDVPDLDEALVACAGMGVNVEIKNFVAEPDYDATHWLSQAVVEATRRADPPVSVLVSSFNIDAIDRVRTLAPSLPTALADLRPRRSRRTVDRAYALPGATARCIRTIPRSTAHWSTPRTIAGSRSTSGRSIDPIASRHLAAMGVDGICTNVPDLARRVIETS